MNKQPVAAVCIDFHNTIAICDRWFELEINELVPAFLHWLSLSTGMTYSESLLTEGRKLYRSLRVQVLESGVEIDAVESLCIVLKRLGIDESRKTINVGLEAIMRPALQETRPVSGAVELIQSLHVRGIPVIIVSSAVYHEFLEWTFQLFDISHQITAIVSSARSGIYKSSPDIYTHAASLLGIDPSLCVHIGDSHRFDVVTAKMAGMRTIWLNTGEVTLGSHQADLAVTSLCDIPHTVLNGHW